MVTRSFSLPVILIPAFLGLGTILAGLPIAGPKSQPEAGSREARQALAAMPIIFEQNIGQSGSQVQFVARGQDYTLGLNGGESRLLLKRPQSHSERRAEFTRTPPLVIDPVLTYSTYLGGGDSDDAEDVAVDDTGLAFVVGSTLSTDSPTSPDPFDTDFGDSNYDGYLTVLDPTQTGAASLLFSNTLPEAVRTK